MKSFVLLDRSGSMASAWAETLGGLNHFVAELAKSEPKAKVTVAAFDSAGFDVVRDGVRAMDWRDVTEAEIAPRSMTPLFDAIGRLGGLIAKKPPKKASVLILTDGAENNSQETTREGAARIVEGWTGAGYDVVYIGADFDAFDEARGLGIGAGQTLNASKTSMTATFAAHGRRTAAYAAGLAYPNVAWSEEDRRRARGD